MKLSEIVAQQNQSFSPFRRWLERGIEFLGDIEAPVSVNELKKVYAKGCHPKRIQELSHNKKLYPTQKAGG